ncbi:HIT family protein [Halocatena marina]|uniref:HIT family protein n=1 Tax=Halocatena marina TaxID=2934937 RepID=UPI00200DC643|nr:HIT family protein [Halocatena marina]
MSECVFCDIADEQESASRLYEDGSTLAFLDAAPATPGHSLVVPLTHYETLTDMEPDLVASVFRTTQRVASAVESIVDPDGLNIIQSNGVAAGQDVFHAHVHIVPRYEADGITLRWPHGQLTDESGRNLAVAIRDEL